jgi:hypothetical protein
MIPTWGVVLICPVGLGIAFLAYGAFALWDILTINHRKDDQ